MLAPRLSILLLLGFAATGASAAERAPLASGAHETVVNGVRLWYRSAGRENGTPVVFLHGGPGQGSQSFAQLAGPALEPRLRMVYLDQRGAGRSERPWDDAYSLDLMVDDLETLRKLWGSDRIALVGHSFGTVIALEYAARYPERVSHLVLAAGVPDVPAAIDIQCARLERTDPEAFARAVAGRTENSGARCNSFRAYEGEAARAFIDRNMFPDAAIKTLVEQADSANGLRNTGDVGRVLFASGFLSYRFERTDRLTMPLLVIAGGADYQAVAEPQRTLAERAPRGRYLEYEGRGHFMWVEDPERFAGDVAAFINGGERSASSP